MPIIPNHSIPENLTPPEPDAPEPDVVPTSTDVISTALDDLWFNPSEDEYTEVHDDDDNNPYEPDLDENEVMLYTGEVVEYSNDLIQLHDSYARPDDPNIVTDYFESDRYIIKFNATPVIENYPIIDSEIKYTHDHDQAFRLGYIRIQSNKPYLGKPSLLANATFNKFYAEDYYTGVFKLKSEIEPFVKQMRVDGIKFNAPSDNNNLPTTYHNTYGKRYSFGLEIETISGLVPAHVLAPLNCSSVHDGSLRDTENNHPYGKEYVTDVLMGDRGLLKLKKLCNELTKRCLVNHQCGVHVHLSNINFNKENIVLMYYLYHKLQREIFTMLPKSRRNNTYCRFLDSRPIINFNIKDLQSFNRDYAIDVTYEAIVRYVSANNNPSKKVNKKNDHPKGYKCGYDHDSARYCWVNFVPALFNTRKNKIYTIEFRPAPGSTSYIKIKNWLLICMALVDIVENHKRFIYENSNLSLAKILTEVYGQKANKLIAWVDKRIAKFNDAEFTENDEYADNELDNNVSLKNL